MKIAQISPKIHAKIVYAMMKTFGKKDLPIYVAPDVLGTKWSRQIREGIRPEETVIYNNKGDS